MKKFDIFLSHSAEDKDFARRLATSLKEKGLGVWLGEEQLKPGKRSTTTLADGLKRSDMVVTVVDPKVVSTEKTFFEAGMAVGLGKELTFILPKAKTGRLPMGLSSGKVVLRKSPSATARDLLKVKKLRT